MKPVRKEGYQFCQDVCIPCYQTNGNGVLKPASFMDLAQEIAYWAAQELGFGYDTLHIHHTAWVLSRMHVHFHRPVCWRDAVTLYTWHKGSNGLFYLRDFLLRSAEGERCVSATSSWVVIDERSRRLVRPEELAELMRLDHAVEDAIAEPAPKVAFPKGDTRSEPGTTEAAGEHRVVYSDIDILGHTNNARYVVWAMDCLPPEAAARPFKDLYINFNKETRLGDTVQLFRLRQENGWLVEGRVDGKSCFVVQLAE